MTETIIDEKNLIFIKKVDEKINTNFNLETNILFQVKLFYEDTNLSEEQILLNIYKSSGNKILSFYYDNLCIANVTVKHEIVRDLIKNGALTIVRNNEKKIIFTKNIDCTEIKLNSISI